MRGTQSHSRLGAPPSESLDTSRVSPSCLSSSRWRRWTSATRVYSDNQGIIGAFDKGRTRHLKVNLSIQRSGIISNALNLVLDLVYMYEEGLDKFLESEGRRAREARAISSKRSRQNFHPMSRPFREHVSAASATHTSHTFFPTSAAVHTGLTVANPNCPTHRHADRRPNILVPTSMKDHPENIAYLPAHPSHPTRTALPTRPAASRGLKPRSSRVRRSCLIFIIKCALQPQQVTMSHNSRFHVSSECLCHDGGRVRNKHKETPVAR